jgi:hypothetical protein
VYRRFVWRRFVEETFCRGDVLYVRRYTPFILYLFPLYSKLSKFLSPPSSNLSPLSNAAVIPPSSRLFFILAPYIPNFPNFYHLQPANIIIPFNNFPPYLPFCQPSTLIKVFPHYPCLSKLSNILYTFPCLYLTLQTFPIF